MVQTSAILDGKKRGILHWGIENKGKSSLTSWNSFVFESTTFFCNPVWWIPVPCDQLVQKAYLEFEGPLLYYHSLKSPSIDVIRLK